MQCTKCGSDLAAAPAAPSQQALPNAGVPTTERAIFCPACSSTHGRYVMWIAIGMGVAVLLAILIPFTQM